jgi:hypothetical protein
VQRAATAESSVTLRFDTYNTYMYCDDEKQNALRTYSKRNVWIMGAEKARNNGGVASKRGRRGMPQHTEERPTSVRSKDCNGRLAVLKEQQGPGG